MRIQMFGQYLTPSAAVARIFQTMGRNRGEDAIAAHGARMIASGHQSLADALFEAAARHPAYSAFGRQQ